MTTEDFDAGVAALQDVLAMWRRRERDEARSPRERLAWAEAAMDLRAGLARQDYLERRASREELERLEQQHAARVRAGETVELEDGEQVRVTNWHSPWCGFNYEPVDAVDASFVSGTAVIDYARDPGLEDRFAEIIAVDEHGEQMLPDDENPGAMAPLRELVRRAYLAMES